MKRLLLLASLVLFSYGSNACNAFFSHTNACVGDTVFFHAMDQAAVYTWDFGDTDSGVANVSHDTDTYHIYNSPGTFSVTLFVNVGVEWDYKTQIITIGNDCFNSDFAYECGGALTINFTNQSIGDLTNVLWNFGDTASGSNDTSSTIDPYHTYSSAGNYLAELIISDGVNFDTSFKTIHVDSNCLSASFYNFLGGDCIQNATTIGVTFTGNPTSFHWDFGDTASGSSNFSTDDTASHQFSSTGLFLVTLIISDSLQTDTFYTVQSIIDCSVWPGNANTDGQVNMEDLFALGIYFGDTGSVRSNATNLWMAQPSTDWDSTSMNFMYLQDLVDKKHADCNGDGVISSLDINAINQNYGNKLPGYTHIDYIQMMPVTASDPVLQVTTPPIWNVSMNVSIPIDLSALDSVRNVYGISARIYYDAASIVPGTMTVDFNGGWIGTNGINVITLVKDFNSYGYIEFAIVRTDKNRVSGNGTIGYLNFTVNQNNAVINFNIDPVIRLITNGFGTQEIFLPVTSMNSQLNIVNAGVNEIYAGRINIYPNPVSEILNISSENNIPINEIMLSDVTGRIVYQEIINNNSDKFGIDVGQFSSGIYIISVTTSKGKINSLVEVK